MALMPTLTSAPTSGPTGPTNLLPPLVRRAAPPATEAEEDRPPGGIEGVAHGLVRLAYGHGGLCRRESSGTGVRCVGYMWDICAEDSILCEIYDNGSFMKLISDFKITKPTNQDLPHDLCACMSSTNDTFCMSQ